MMPLEMYQAAVAAAESGEYDKAVELLAELDAADDSFAQQASNLRNRIAQLRKEEPTSAGTSSLTSGDRPDTSGGSALETGSFLQSLAPETGSLSNPDLPPDQPPSSSADTADGSTQETGASQQSPQDYSEGSTEETPPTQVQIDPAAEARDAIVLARQAYDEKEYDAAEQFLDEADRLDPSVASETAMARQAVVAARAANA